MDLVWIMVCLANAECPPSRRQVAETAAALKAAAGAVPPGKQHRIKFAFLLGELQAADPVEAQVIEICVEPSGVGPYLV